MDFAPRVSSPVRFSRLVPGLVVLLKLFVDNRLALHPRPPAQRRNSVLAPHLMAPALLLFALEPRYHPEACTMDLE